MSVLGTAAAVASFFIPGGQTGAYAMYAYGIGSTVENLINPPQIQGPRLNDLTTQMSVYGAPIPFEWGLNRHAGTIIWPQTLTAVESEHSEDAKGGPEATTFTYALTYAVLICEGPIAGVRRAWRNKKLVYDMSVGNTGATTDPVAGTLRFYLGTETQDVDPLIFATDGPSPAYLGWAYVVIENEDVTEFGGRPSQWEFELMTSGSTSPLPPTNLGAGGPVVFHQNLLWTVSGANCYVYDPSTLALLHTIALPYSSNSITVDTNSSTVWCGYTQDGNSATALASGVSPVTFTIVDSTKFGSGSAVSKHGTVFWSEALGRIYSFVDLGLDAGTGRYYAPLTSATGISGITTTSFVFQALEMQDIAMVALTGDGRWLVLGDLANDVTLTTVTNTAWSTGQQVHRVQYDAARGCIYWSALGAPGVYKINLTTYVLTLLCNTAGNVDSLYFSPVNDLIYVESGTALDVYLPATGSLTTSFAGYGVLSGLSRGNSVNVGSDTHYFVGELGAAPGVLWKVEISSRLIPDQVAHSTIVSDICVKSDLLTSDINVTALTDLVDGYKIGAQMTGRAAIEPTLQAYNAAAVESDHKIKFVKLGGAIAATIPASDRAAHEFGSSIPDSLSITRAFELEIPNECDIEYPDVNADHLTGNQYARRLIKETKQKIDIQMPIVMSGTKALQIAETALYQAWLNQSFRWTTTRKYAYLEPTDPVYLTTDQVTYGVRITKRRDQPNGVIEWEGRMEDPYTYMQSGSGAATVGYLPQTIITPPDTVLALMDCAMLRDEDDNAGFYCAMGGEL